MTTTSDSDEASPPADPSIGPRTPNTQHEGDTEAEELRVVDRRWWKTKDDTAADGVEAAGRKPAYVEELEQRVASLNDTVREYAGKYKSASQEFEDARARMRRELGKEAERDRRTFLAELLDVVDNLDRAIAAGQTGTDALAGELKENVRRTGGYKVPGQIVFVADLPRTTLMKIDRRTLREMEREE